MVRRKRLRKSVLAIVMALCLLCGTVQTSTVVYATEPEEEISVTSSNVEEADADENEEDVTEEENAEEEEEGVEAENPAEDSSTYDDESEASNSDGSNSTEQQPEAQSDAQEDTSEESQKASITSVVSSGNESSSEESTVVCEHGNDIENCAICAVQALIDALPSVEEMADMSTDELNEVYTNTLAANDAWETLTVEEQEAVDDSKLDEVFNYFNNAITLSAEEVTAVAKIGEVTYGTLQEAIDAAGSGETVTLLCDLTEDVSITSGQNLTLDLGGYTLMGTGEVGKPVIDNYGGTLKLTNGTVTGGYGMYGQRNSARTWYAGGNIYNSGTLEVSYVTIKSNVSGANVRGGGIYTEGSLSLDNVTIEDCSAGTGANGGPAIYATGCEVSIQNSTFRNNLTNLTSDGTIYYTSADAKISLDNCFLINNSGGGLYINQAASVSVTNCEISGNNKISTSNAVKGIAIYVNSNTESVTIKNCTIKNNTGSGATTSAACLAAVSLNDVNDVTITGCEITGNTVSNSGKGGATGGGLYLNKNSASATATITNTLITGNSASSGGGIWMSYAGTLTITDSAICGNTATSGDDSDDIYIKSSNQPTMYLLPASDMSYGSEVSAGDYNAWLINSGEQDTGSFPAGSTASVPVAVTAGTTYCLKAVSVNTGDVVTNTKTSTSYTYISAAIDAATEDDELKMLDITGRSNESVTFDKSLTLDLNGQTLKGVKNSDPDAVLEVAQEKTLTLTNSSDSTGAVGASNNAYSVYLNENAILKLSSDVELVTPVYLSKGSSINLTDSASDYENEISITLSEALAEAANNGTEITLITVGSADADELNSLLEKVTVTNDLSLYCSLKVSEDGKSIVLYKNTEGVYLDGLNGSDGNEGTYNSPVKTFAQAKVLLEEYGYDTIYVIGTVTVSSDETWSLDEGQSLERYETFTNDPLVEVTNGILTLENITIDGREIETTSSLILVNGGNLVIEDETVIQNNKHAADNSMSEKEAAVTVLSGTLTMNGGTISNNSGNWGGGIAVIAKDDNKAELILNGGTITGNDAADGGGIFLYGNATLTMNGGSITENKATQNGGGIAVWSGAVAYIYAGDISSNTQTWNNTWGGGGIYVNGAGDGGYGAGKLYLYNVEMTGNTSYTSLTDGYNKYRATISVCETGTLDINMTEGSVIHDNNTLREIVLNTSEGEGTFKLSPFMLSGGAYNWTLEGESVDVESLIVDRDSLLQFDTDITELTGLDRITTTINNNSAYGCGAAIGVNGELYIGHDDGEVSLEITKTWSSDIDESDIESIEVEIIATNSQGTETSLGTVMLNESDGWTKTISGLPKYDSFYDSDTQTSGTYTYTVKELSGDYFSIVTYEEVDDGDDDADTVSVAANIVNLQKTKLTLQKTVTGATSAESFAFTVSFSYDGTPYSGTVEGTDSNGEAITVEFVNGEAVVSLAANDKITLILGVGMTYSIEETDSQDALDVTYTVNETAGAGTEVSGTLTTDNLNVVFDNNYESVTVSVVKTWDDADDQDGKRPESITVNLLANGEIIDSQTVTSDDDWVYTFTNLPKYSDGVEITYGITEEAVEDYSTTYDGYNIMNSYTPGQTSITVTKSWNDSNNQDGLRPSSVTVTLLKNGSATEQTVILSASNNWTASFTNLDQYTDGEENVYSVAEANVPSGYTAVISGDASTGFTITNTHTVTTTETEDPGDDSDTTTDTTASEETVSTVATEVVSAVTGDNAPIGIAILVAAVSEFTLLILIFLQMRKKKDEVM